MNLWVVLVLVSEVLARAIHDEIEMHSSYPGMQQLLNTSDTDVMSSVQSGMELAIEHCQKAFKWDRWNCPREEFERKTIQVASRETAFVKAIIAAGIVHAVTKNCSKGELADCGCNPNYPSSHYEEYKKIGQSNSLASKKSTPPPVKWSWGGCSDDTSFGVIVAKSLLEIPLNVDPNVSSYINTHNYKIGEEVVKQTMKRKCRCHGVSGSCSLQTCWLQQADFQDVAKKLKERYKKAKRVTYEFVANSLAVVNTINNKRKEKKQMDSFSVLVYMDESPDYCVSDPSNSRPGTKGRTCSKGQNDGTTRSEKRSCKVLCKQCGHKVRKEKKIVTKRCNCKFEWCCAVKCDMCSEKVEEYFCY
ncbi:protein Wnt-8a-like [Euwallacea similis]|uniref:protein Wnt-8a-like n=1 Tax=Euwallacea similis TaxID=1736056 RepID=UPI003450EB2B